MGPVTCSGGFEAALRAFVEASVEAYTLGHSADALRAEARAALAEKMLAAAEAKAEAAEARAVDAQRFIDSFINS